MIARVSAVILAVLMLASLIACDGVSINASDSSNSTPSDIATPSLCEPETVVNAGTGPSGCFTKEDVEKLFRCGGMVVGDLVECP